MKYFWCDNGGKKTPQSPGTLDIDYTAINQNF